MPRKKTITLALTGSFGSGKSTARKIFKDLGAYVIDCDQIARELTSGGHPLILNAIRRFFGPRVFDSKNELKREVLAQIVFANPKKRMILESLLHPKILSEVKKRLKRASATIRVVEVPLLFEAWDKNKARQAYFDAAIVVYAKTNAILKRLKKVSITREEFYSRTRNQMPIELKLKRADFILDNSGSCRKLKEQISDIHKACEFLINTKRSQ